MEGVMTVEGFPIEAGHVLMFRRAVGHEAAENGADTASSQVVPATFVQSSAQFDPSYVLRPVAGRTWFGSGADAGFMPEGGGGLHAEQHYVYHRPVRIGDVLSAAVRDGRSWQKSGRSGVLHFSETITEYVDESGASVVTATSVGVRQEPHGTEAT
jgi:hypothetical protein